MRGRKKETEARRNIISVRVTEEAYEVYRKNKMIRDEIIKQVNEYLSAYSFKSEK